MSYFVFTSRPTYQYFFINHGLGCSYYFFNWDFYIVCNIFPSLIDMAAVNWSSPELQPCWSCQTHGCLWFWHCLASWKSVSLYQDFWVTCVLMDIFSLTTREWAVSWLTPVKDQTTVVLESVWLGVFPSGEVQVHIYECFDVGTFCSPQTFGCDEVYCSTTIAITTCM